MPGGRVNKSNNSADKESGSSSSSSSSSSSVNENSNGSETETQEGGSSTVDEVTDEDLTKARAELEALKAVEKRKFELMEIQDQVNNLKAGSSESVKMNDPAPAKNTFVDSDGKDVESKS